MNDFTAHGYVRLAEHRVISVAPPPLVPVRRVIPVGV
jgi:hypothetical protein